MSHHQSRYTSREQRNDLHHSNSFRSSGALGFHQRIMGVRDIHSLSSCLGRFHDFDRRWGGYHHWRGPGNRFRLREFLVPEGPCRFLLPLPIPHRSQLTRRHHLPLHALRGLIEDHLPTRLVNFHCRLLSLDVDEPLGAVGSRLLAHFAHDEVVEVVVAGGCLVSVFHGELNPTIQTHLTMKNFIKNFLLYRFTSLK